MKVLTSNIIVATSPEAVERFFSFGSLTKNLINDINRDNDILLFSNQANPNFISFKHSFGVEGGDQGFTISFIDPKNEFEKRFIENTPINISNTKKFLYIAYGIGDNIKSWSGPYKTTLIDADFAVDGEKKVTIKLSPNDKSLSPGGPFSDNLDFSYFGATIENAGYSKKVNVNKLVEESSKKIYSPTDYGISQQKGSSPPMNGILKEVDYHFLILDAFREYLSTVFHTKNIVLLFPNLNILCQKQIDRIVNTENIDNPILQTRTLAVLHEMVEMLGLSLIDTNQMEGGVALGVDYELPGLPPPDKITREKSGDYVRHMTTNNFDSTHNLGDKQKNSKKEFTQAHYKSCFCTIRSGKVINHKKVVTDFINNIKSVNFSDYGLNLVQFTEANPKVVEYWKSISDDNITFGGYSKLVEEEPVVVIGDFNMIKTFLYNKGQMSNFNLVHPLDSKLFSTDYKKNVDEATGLDDSIDPFNTTNTFPDNFAYGGFTEDEKTYIKEKNIPIFKYNTTNSNIKKLKFKNKGVYLTNLNLGYRETVERYQTGITGSEVDYFPKGITDYSKAITYLIQKGYANDIPQEEKDNIQQGLKDKLNAADLATDANLVAERCINFLEVLHKEDSKAFLLLKQFAPGSAYTSFLNFMSQMYKQSRQLSITTLPLFHVTRGSLLRQPCVALIQDAPIFGTNLSTRNLLNTFYSGAYTILGFTHTITSTSAESKFFLEKQLASRDLELKLPKEEISPPPGTNQSTGDVGAAVEYY